jgi:hypothetical protein
MKRLMIICAVAGMALSVSPALATTVALAPGAANVSPGSTVTVSVDMSSPGITMTAISARFLYDPSVFIYNDASIVPKGALLTHDWSFSGGTPTPGELRIGGIDWSFGENIAAGSGTLFSFNLTVKGTAPAGLSLLTWGVYDGIDNATAGFDYGDGNFSDVILLDSEMSGASVNVIPEPMTLALLGFGGLMLRRRMA